MLLFLQLWSHRKFEGRVCLPTLTPRLQVSRLSLHVLLHVRGQHVGNKIFRVISLSNAILNGRQNTTPAFMYTSHVPTCWDRIAELDQQLMILRFPPLKTIHSFFWTIVVFGAINSSRNSVWCLCQSKCWKNWPWFFRGELSAINYISGQWHA